MFNPSDVHKSDHVPDDESVEVMESFEDDTDSKPAARTAFDVAVDYGDDNFFLN